MSRPISTFSGHVWNSFLKAIFEKNNFINDFKLNEVLSLNIWFCFGFRKGK